jgi:hypothetical protein
MTTTRGWLVLTALALLSACAGDTQDDVLPRDSGADGTTPTAADSARDDAPEATPVADVPPVETRLPDPSATEAGREVSVGAPEVQRDVIPDATPPDAAPDTAGETGPAPSYPCRDDSDCCIKIDTCMAKAYLYSNAPGASPAPTIPTITDPGQCLRCIPPGVQVRCDLGQCVGEKLSGISALTKNHCGTLSLTDGGSSPAYTPAYAGAQQTVWGC